MSCLVLQGGGERGCLRAEPLRSPPLWGHVHPVLGDSVDGLQSPDGHKAHSTPPAAWAPALNGHPAWAWGHEGHTWMTHTCHP